jgi:hypothetical protein
VLHQLPARFWQNAPLNADDRSTYYGGDAKEYTDYLTLAQPVARARDDDRFPFDVLAHDRDSLRVMTAVSDRSFAPALRGIEPLAP